MALSRLILDIFDLAFDECEYGGKLREQVPFLRLSDQEHTGIGLYIYFKGGEGIQQYKIPTVVSDVSSIQEYPVGRLDGVEIRNDALNILADASVHIENGIIDCVEIFNKNGEDYPTEELKNYTLVQAWLDKNRRREIHR